MIRSRFLSEEDRNKLIALARDGSVASRVTRRANALVLLDDGWSCQEVADAFLLNDDTIRGWFKLFEQHGIEGLTSFDMGGSASFLSAAQEEALKVFVLEAFREDLCDQKPRAPVASIRGKGARGAWGAARTLAIFSAHPLKKEEASASLGSARGWR